MKIKFKAISAAAILAVASMTASATISTGVGAAGTPAATPDLLFVAFDNSGNTYVRDLGTFTSTLLNTSQSFSAPASSIFSSIFASDAPSAIQWDVVALNSSNGAGAVWTTGDIDSLTGLTAANVRSTVAIVTSPLGATTQLDNAANGYSFANGEYTGSKVLSDQTNALTIASNLAFGAPSYAAGVGASENFLKVATNGSVSQLYVNSSLSAFGDGSDAAGGYFTLTDAQGDLSWTNVAAVSSVPLPAAALLFLPGLLGMFGLGRRGGKTLAA